MAISTMGNRSVLTTPASFSVTSASTSGTGTSARPTTGQSKPVAMWCTSGSVVLPNAHPSALLPPAVANSLSRSPRALQSCSMKLREGKPGAGQLEDLIKSKNELNPVVVYSKTWCPYCRMVKSLFEKLGVAILPVELDELVDQQAVQAALQRISGQSTVPNVFIGGQHIGGCDDTMALHSKGGLLPLLKAAGAKFTPV